MNPIKKLGLGLTLAAALAAPSVAAAQEPGGSTRPVPQTGSSCEGERACEEAARQCRGTVVQVVVRDAAGAPTLLGWCDAKTQKHRLGCVGKTSCKALKDLCLKAAGSYTETTGGTKKNPTVAGTCTLPPPPAAGREKKTIYIYCSAGTPGDCEFLAGYCAGVGGTYLAPPEGICTYKRDKPRDPRELPVRG